MKSFIVLMSALVAMNAWAFLPEISGDSPTTKIENATLICQDSGVMFAIDDTIGAERVWQSDAGDSEGLELAVLQFDRARCPYCFQIEAELQMFGEKLLVELDISGTQTPGGWKAEAQVAINGEPIKSLLCFTN